MCAALTYFAHEYLHEEDASFSYLSIQADSQRTIRESSPKLRVAVAALENQTERLFSDTKDILDHQRAIRSAADKAQADADALQNEIDHGAKPVSQETAKDLERRVCELRLRKDEIKMGFTEHETVLSSRLPEFGSRLADLKTSAADASAKIALAEIEKDALLAHTEIARIRLARARYRLNIAFCTLVGATLVGLSASLSGFRAWMRKERKA